jgi:iron(III) transport system substrate-binding protein
MRGSARAVLLIATVLWLQPLPAGAQSDKGNWQSEWEKILQGAKKEGKVVVSIPASAELRKTTEEAFRRSFPGIEIEMVTGRGAAVVRRIQDEAKAGIRYFDIHLGGSSSAVSGLLAEGALDPIEPSLILPEVKEAKHWWGGHMWVDRAKRYIYSFQAYLTESMWYNANLAQPDEVRSYDDFLHPKWKGKIGFLDPRTPGAGDANWSYMWMVKGEDYLKKLAAQNVLIGRDQRLLADNLAKGKIALVVGLTHYTFLPFLRAGLPVKPLPPVKEGTYGTGGSGNLTIIKNPPHPNAARVFVNWLLGKEGQEIFTRAMGQATRRLDVDTKWLTSVGVLPAKDHLTLKQFLESENQSEERLEKVREPALKIAHRLLG